MPGPIRDEEAVGSNPATPNTATPNTATPTTRNASSGRSASHGNRPLAISSNVVDVRQ